MESTTIKKPTERIQDRSLHLSVLGSGYIGLPTAALFADAGFHVVALDLKSEVVEAVNSGTSLINEPNLSDLVSHNVQAGRLEATLNCQEALTQVNGVIISVQTPTYQNKKPNLSFLMRAVEDVGKNLKKEMLVVVSSTVPPGTMLEEVKPKLESLSSLEVETQFYLAYVPERVSPGKALKEFVESPRLIGGIGPNSTKMAAELFRTVCKKVIQTDAATAELTKLAENTFRDVNIAFSNQLALICEEQGVDVAKVIELANTHPRVNIHTPGPGVGGPCLPKDPYFLLNSFSETDHDLIKMARLFNDYMPKHILKLIFQTLKNADKDVKNSKIAILGTAYKGDVGDPRFSPSRIIIRELMRLGAEVTSYDPYCNENFGAKNTNSLNEAIQNADCIAIVTDHTQFKELNIHEIKTLMNDKPVIIDGRRILDPHECANAGFIYKGLGFGEKVTKQK
jgi:UDP-N-acetyl-D-mannosaminuronic acid dehydrogenase